VDIIRVSLFNVHKENSYASLSQREFDGLAQIPGIAQMTLEALACKGRQFTHKSFRDIEKKSVMMQ